MTARRSTGHRLATLAVALAAVAAAGAAPAQAPAHLRLLPRKSQPAPPEQQEKGASPAWLTSFDAAVAAAAQRRSLLLLYFTATW